ncbi:MAG: glycosyltransferase family 9 protein, partial [Nitrospinaceae bacterium]
MVQSTPLLVGLRRKYSKARTTLVAGSAFAEFSKRLPGIDERVFFDLKQFKESSPGPQASWVRVYRYLETFLEGLQRCRFDMVFNLSHSKLSALMIAYLGIPEVRGFRCNASGERMTDHPWLQYFFTEPFNRSYNTFNLVDIFSRAGDLVPDSSGVSLTVYPEDEQKGETILKAEGVAADEVLIGLQAGSSLEGRRWESSRFAQLADLLVESMNARILLFGVASESRIAREIRQEMRRPDRALDLTGRTDLGALIGLLSRCRYLVTNDTGTMHIAAALGVPIVGLFFAHAHPPETGPYAPGHLVFQANLPCAPCSYGVECNHIVCVEQVDPAVVHKMMEKHFIDGQWTPPPFEPSLQGTLIYFTERDGDGCLRMRPLLRHPLSLTNVLAGAYRRLWLDTLTDPGARPSMAKVDEAAQTFRVDYDLTAARKMGAPLNAILRGIDTLHRLAEKGLNTLRSFIPNLETGGIRPERLKGLAAEISNLDEEITLIGFTRPELKPLADMFNKRKENIDGEALRPMAQATQDCYFKLLQESRGLKEILDHFSAELGLLAAVLGRGSRVSKRMDVAGRNNPAS